MRTSAISSSSLAHELLCVILGMTSRSQSSQVRTLRNYLYLSNCYAVEDIYTPDRVKEAIEVFGADDPAHPSVAYLRNRVKDFYVGGKVQAIQAPTHFDYVALRCKQYTFFPKIQLADDNPYRHTCRAAITLQKARMAQSCGFPNSQPNAQSSP
jgi:hypothetical protein